MNERERDLADAKKVIEESILVRAVRGAIAFVARPFEDRRMPAAALQRPLYMVSAIVAVLTHAILLQFVPDRVAPVKPMAYWMVVAFAALVAMAGFIITRPSATPRQPAEQPHRNQTHT